MDKFWDLLQTSTLVQGLVTITFVWACVYMACTGRPIPAEMWTATMVALGFYFGSKSQQVINASRRNK